MIYAHLYQISNEEHVMMYGPYESIEEAKDKLKKVVIKIDGLDPRKVIDAANFPNYYLYIVVTDSVKPRKHKKVSLIYEGAYALLNDYVLLKGKVDE